MADGWIKLWRQIWMSDIWKGSEPFCKRAAWIDLILMANHEAHTVNTKDGPITIERGQLHTSVAKLAHRWHWSEGKVRRFIERTKRQEMVQTKRQGNGTTLTIENYTFYQDTRRTNSTTDGRTDGITDGTRTRRKEEKNTAPGRLERLPASSKDDEDPGAIFA